MTLQLICLTDALPVLCMGLKYGYSEVHLAYNVALRDSPVTLLSYLRQTETCAVLQPAQSETKTLKARNCVDQPSGCLSRFEQAAIQRMFQ